MLTGHTGFSLDPLLAHFRPPKNSWLCKLLTKIEHTLTQYELSDPVQTPQHNGVTLRGYAQTFKAFETLHLPVLPIRLHISLSDSVSDSTSWPLSVGEILVPVSLKRWTSIYCCLSQTAHLFNPAASSSTSQHSQGILVRFRKVNCHCHEGHGASNCINKKGERWMKHQSLYNFSGLYLIIGLEAYTYTLLMSVSILALILFIVQLWGYQYKWHAILAKIWKDDKISAVNISTFMDFII